MNLEVANKNEAQTINELLNLAYRGDKGWTTETHLVDGDRSTISDIEHAIKNTHFLVVKNNTYDSTDNHIIACICLEPKGDEIYIGAFAVHPDHQAEGLGKSVLTAAEDYAVNTLNAKQFIMVVLSQRTELIAFYERRGYQRSGVNQEYPLHLNVGTPKSNDLTIEQLYKKA